jgi:hypothetical protein
MPSAAFQRKSAKASRSRLAALVVRSNAVLVALAVLLFAVQIIDGQQNSPQQTCPPASEISPCVCTVKKNGLDILCEATDYTHISRAMTTLKPKSPIIFYLKLRHNSLPKLQGFIFLALDIKHLTIHNSSLAVIEETSLSSLGEFCDPCHCCSLAVEGETLFWPKVSSSITCRRWSRRGHDCFIRREFHALRSFTAPFTLVSLSPSARSTT